MKKRTVWISILAAAVVIAALPKLMGGKEEPKPRNASSASSKGSKASVRVQIVKVERIEQKLVIPGTIMAREQVDLKSEAAGRVVGRFFREGGEVKKGQLLVKLNDAELQAQLMKARAAMAVATEKAGRQRKLLENEIISREDYEDAVRDLESSRADSALLAAQLLKTEVRAPFDGRIGLANINDGEYLSPGSQIARLVALRPLKIEFAVPERYFRQITSGREISFTVQGSPVAYKGSVYAAEPAINEKTRTVSVRALCNDPDKRIAPGAFAEVTVVLGTNDKAILLPSPALVPDATGQKVFVVQGKTAVPRAVTTGIRHNDRVEIAQGLSAGDTVVVSGVLLLRPGMPVEIQAIE